MRIALCEARFTNYMREAGTATKNSDPGEAERFQI